MFESIFETVNAGFAQALYEEFLKDPASVPAEWRALFENGLQGARPATAGSQGMAGSASKGAPAASPAATAAPAGLAAPGSAEPITGPALRLLENMQASLTVPTATSFREIDVTRLAEVRAAANEQLKTRNIKLSFTHVIAWAIVRAVPEFPAMARAVVEVEGAPHRLDPGGVHLGLAVDVQRKDGSRGLLVPVIKHAERMTFAQFHAEYERLVAGARDGKLMPDAYVGGTITLTNPGTIGTVASVPRLMKGQGSIIATGAIRERDGARVMTITSTYDHRIIQGAESGLFLRLVDELLQGEKGFFEEIAAALGLALATTAAVGAAAGRAAVPKPETPPAAVAAGASAAQAARREAVDQEFLHYIAAAMSLVRAHRTHGYLCARLDPLGTPPVGDPAVDPGPAELTPDILARIPARLLRVYVPGETLADALPRLRETYCGTIAYEIEHIASHEQRVWLRQVIESGQHRTPLTPEEQRRLLELLTKVDVLERFLHKAYLGHKRFGIEGLDMLVPMLHWACTLAADHGANEVVIGMAHRGRLNVLTHVLGRAYETLLAEFEGGREVEETLAPSGGTGDVKYHHGAEGRLVTGAGGEIRVVLQANPSHLEAVNPVVEGRARAGQTRRDFPKAHHDSGLVLPVLVHGDAAFAAQGVVAETLNLARLEGFGTGGTLHIIANNQVGFTTDPRDARSTDYASDLAKGFDVPIVHVNADDTEACIAAVRLAMMYRRRFHGDCVIDLVGYRRHGHNEGDEPRYTQPQMYERIDRHPTARKIYADALVAQGLVRAEEAEHLERDAFDRLVATQRKLRAELTAGGGEEPVRISATWVPAAEPETSVPESLLRELNDALLRVPDGFAVHPKLAKQLERRRDALVSGTGIDWGHAEALAFASLLAEGVPIRLTGQDTERGTFSQRHLVLHDMATGRRYAPSQHLPHARASFELHNSPLSEYAVLGFEYGYAVAAPEALVLWEAQFGDFANAAEVIIDQFIIAGLAKWGQTSRLTLLLPHGYEGQGPEHSSARLERYLALGAEGNIRVANCSTPAQYFHLLRRQAKHSELRPLILMTPKSLLRLPQATSSVPELSVGRFHAVLDDPGGPGDRGSVRRLVLCSGKVFYDVMLAERRRAASHVALGRIELLYPFPAVDVRALIAAYPALREIVWLQEEPSNMGARKWVVPQLETLAPPNVAVRYVARPERSSPAEGYPAAHRAQQDRLIADVLA
ncbi:MAG TPA: multifunctional oxoglutarate decarboxylase/oxoglutarate dehydrogenase thiamine pyrophosphate-binding subunit/dihydrolipoyllysine-residue succinyltransferase subunit [Gemmatimonadales bacterium]|nr:multifunctional oxoglutarate decarboxylase/oxoglutarate dehydrogenase thiamine pyrophosphate-binding subunit/dihydrolipoyllysine-residue succinyltransferase subunit [Gemmatimonadales bacterium]